MIILRHKKFSRIQDEDYRDELEKNKKSVKHAKRNGALGGGALGALTGIAAGHSAGPKAVLIGSGIGATIGGIAGYHFGKKEKKEVEAYVDKMMKRYENANEKDKEYLRKKLAKDKLYELKKQQIAAQSSQANSQYIMALNSWK